MASTQPFSDKEMSRLSNAQTAKSGSAEDQFFQECIELVRIWLQTRNKRGDAAPPDTQAILFIFSEAPKVDYGFDENTVSKQQQIRKKQGTLGEGIVVCNQNFKVMLKVHDNLTIDDAYNFAENHLFSITSFAIAKVGQYAIQIHRKGQDLDEWLDDPEEISINIEEINLTPVVIANDLQRFHDSYLRTSQARAARHMWVLPPNELQYRLGPHPEQHIQSFLLSHLDGLYGRSSVFVNEEIINPGGRSDIIIERPGQSISKKVNTIIELKVLAPTKSSTANKNWAISGIDQADSYRNHDTDAAFACLFDAQRQKMAIPEITPYAQSKNVLIKQYLMDVPENAKKATTSKKSNCEK